ncbi:MAG: sigma-70 family RNA polymerase sigma factor [Phycisphaerae bacterium]
MDDRVERAAAGDRLALTLLLTEAHRELCAFVERKIPASLRGRVDAEDIVQVAHADAFRRIGDFRDADVESFARWLRTIALRKLRNAIRDRNALKRGAERQVDAAADPLMDSTARLIELLAVNERTPSQSAARREAVAAVQLALASLPEEMREVVTRVHIAGQPVAEVAAALGRTPGAVYNLCYRARQTLEARLGDRSRFLSR